MFQCSIANDLFPLLWPNTNNVPALPALGSWRGALEGWFQSPHWLVLGDHAVALRALQPPSLFSWDLHPPPHDRVSGVDSFITYEIRGRPLGRNIMRDLKFGRATVLRVCRASVVFPVHISRCRPPKIVNRATVHDAKSAHQLTACQVSTWRYTFSNDSSRKPNHVILITRRVSIQSHCGAQKTSRWGGFVNLPLLLAPQCWPWYRCSSFYSFLGCYFVFIMLSAVCDI